MHPPLPHSDVTPPSGTARPRLALPRWLGGRRLKIPPRRVMVWSVFSALPMAMVILVGSYLSWHYHHQLVQSRLQVDYTHQVLGELNQLLLSLQDAETGQRGYIITGDDAYLAPYNVAVETTGPAFDRLRALLEGSQSQNLQMDRLEDLIDAKLVELSDTIALRRRAGFAPAAARIAEGHGKQLMDAVRDEVARASQTERRLLHERQERSRERERATLQVGMYVAALSILMRVLLAVVLVQLRRRQLLS